MVFLKKSRAPSLPRPSGHVRADRVLDPVGGRSPLADFPVEPVEQGKILLTAMAHHERRNAAAFFKIMQAKAHWGFQTNASWFSPGSRP